MALSVFSKENDVKPKSSSTARESVPRLEAGKYTLEIDKLEIVKTKSNGDYLSMKAKVVSAKKGALTPEGALVEQKFNFPRAITPEQKASLSSSELEQAEIREKAMESNLRKFVTLLTGESEADKLNSALENITAADVLKGSKLRVIAELTRSKTGREYLKYKYEEE